MKPTTLLPAVFSLAHAALPCKDIEVDKLKFDFSPLAGPHTVVTTEYAPPSYYNRTYTLDLCAPLERKGEVKEELKCPKGTHVCAIKHHWDAETKKSNVEEVIPIAGDLASAGGGEFKWEATRLKTADDKEHAGIKVVLKGGVWEGREQRAVVEFRCNKTVAGTEEEWEGEDEYVKPKAKREEKKIGEPEKQLKKDGAALIWDGYKRSVEGEKEVDTLFLTWQTKFACESAEDKKPDPTPPSESGGWGFFTWFIVLMFMAIAAYLIFGSWLNYNRYGARGLDLLPHADTLRDVPYLLKDWTRRVLNTVQSSGSRGGYSAV